MSHETTLDAIRAGKVECRTCGLRAATPGQHYGVGTIVCPQTFGWGPPQPRSWEADLPARSLGDVLGSMHDLGACPGCGRQFHSRHTLVLVVGHETYCTRCKGAALAALARRRP